ncbi:MAG: hypothetical protein FWF69_07170 [Firmicutes bacterium]|nr:hypothetical protein [Bacillota bacterium]
MKAGRTLLTAGILALCCVGAALAAEGMPQIPWLSHTLAVKCVEDSPARIEGKPEPVGERYIVITFKPMEERIDIFDIADHVDMFSVEDASGHTYTAVAFFPHSILFLSAPGVFSMSPRQAAFDMMFVVPGDTPLDALKLTIEETVGGKAHSVPLSEILLISLEE